MVSDLVKLQLLWLKLDLENKLSMMKLLIKSYKKICWYHEKAEVAPIAQPTLNIDSVDNDNLKITILCPVKPEVELGEYKGLEVKR